MMETLAIQDHRDNDTIAVDAVNEFCMRPRPLRDDIARLTDLVLPLLALIGDDSRRQIASALAASDLAPKALLLALCDFPPAICSPILMGSKVLNDAELLAIVSQHGEDHARAIARRQRLAPPVFHALKSLKSEAVDRALDLRKRPDTALPPEQAQSFARFEAMINGDVASQARPAVATDILELVSLARDPNPVLFRTAIADALAITITSATALCSNPTSRNLIYMLRFIGAPFEQAFAIFTALAPNLAEDPAVARRFEAAFDEVSADQAVRKIWTWRSDDLLALAREALAANDPGTPVATEEDATRFEGDTFMEVA